MFLVVIFQFFCLFSQSLTNGCFLWCNAGVKVGAELLTVDGMMVSELDMIYIESILKASSSVDVRLRSSRAESTNDQPSAPPSARSLPQSQDNLVADVAVSSSAEASSNRASAGKIETASVINQHKRIIINDGIMTVGSWLIRCV